MVGLISPEDEKFYEMATQVLKGIDNPELAPYKVKSLMKELCTHYRIPEPKIYFRKKLPKFCLDKHGNQLYSGVYRNFFYEDKRTGMIDYLGLNVNSIVFYDSNPYLSTVCHEFTHHLQAKHFGHITECEDHVFGTRCVMRKALEILSRL